MQTSHPRRRSSVARTLTGVVALTTMVGLAGTAAPASANPGDGGPGGNNGVGDIYITSATTLATGQKLYFAGENFAEGSSTTHVMQKLSLKLDAASSTDLYTGTAAGASAVVGTYQVQADGTVSGSVVIPDDIDSEAVNPASHAGPHFLRFLGSAPATSRWSEDFTVSAAAPAVPQVSATATTASSRGAVRTTLAVTGSGFDADAAVTATEQPSGEVLGTLTADATGAVSGSLTLTAGVLPSGERQIVFSDQANDDNPGVAQVDVKPVAALANLALGGTGTLTVSNLTTNSVIDSVKLDPSDAEGDEVEVLAAPATAGSTAVATGTVNIPDQVSYLGTRTFVVHQSAPYEATYTVSAKVSPSSATFGEDGYARVETATGAVAQGLYQSVYSPTADALFATTAYSGDGGWDGLLLKLDADTLDVEASARAGLVGDTTARYAPYGVGLDDVNGTVWVTNTRQNTVAVYSRDDLSLLAQHTADTGYVSHSRDVVADPARGYVFVTSASEGSSGDGYISVFEADDKDGDGVKYEKIKDIAVYPRTTFSPMSLELDAEHHKLFTVSLTTQRAMVVDTETLEDTIIELPDLTAGGRGASGVAYDPETNRLFVASQNSDELMIAQLDDAMTSGTTVKEIATGAGALNVSFDPVHRLAYVANFGGTTITVVDPDGDMVANLPFSKVNHIAEDGQGSVYAVNKDTDNQVIKLTPKISAGTPAISGKAQVGKELTVKPGTWSDGATLRYQWQRNGVDIAGATKPTYTPVAADAGKKLGVVVTGSGAGYAAQTATSASTGAVAKGVLTSAKPKVTGTAKVGKKLTAKAGSWTKGTKLAYRWKANGKAIKGAKGRTLRLGATLKGKKITVTVTGTLAGYASASATSAATKAVAK